METPTTSAQISRIQSLKKELGVLILAHNYTAPEIYSGIADITGDSLALAREAVRASAQTILVCGVRFMAETVKLLCPDKTVLLPEPKAGCTLADSINPGHIELLRRRHPGLPVITYVNSSIETKAASDHCCTSGNIAEMLAELPESELILVPDRHLAAYGAAMTGKTIHSWNGTCVVHDGFSTTQIAEARELYGDAVRVIAHPECPKEIIEDADYTGSTSAIISYIRQQHPETALVLSDDTMNCNLARTFPQTRFLSSGRSCPFMKMITLEKIEKCLKDGSPEIDIPAHIAEAAARALASLLQKEHGQKSRHHENIETC